MTPENTASTIAQAGESTPENAELSATMLLLTRRSPPLRSSSPLGAAPRKPLDPGIECDPRIGR